MAIHEDFPPTTLVSVAGREGRFIVVPTSARVMNQGEVNVMDSAGSVSTVTVDRLTKIADAPDIAADRVWQHPKVDQDLATARNNLRLHIEEARGYLAKGDPVEKVFIGYAKSVYDQRERWGPAHLAMMMSIAVVTLAQTQDASPQRSIYDDPRLENEFIVEAGPDDGSGSVDLIHITCRHTIGTVPANQKASPTYLLDLCLLHLRECG